MIADASEEIDIPAIKVGIYLEEWGGPSSWFGDYVYFCQKITLDLNGHVLSAFFDSGESIVTIGKKRPLTLTDSNPTAEHPFTVDDNGLYSWDEDFNSQVSSRLKTDEDGNDFWDDEATTVTVKGGCITGAARGQFDNASTLRTIAGVYNHGGTFNMTAGTITGNSGDIGGGVYNEAGSTMTVSGKAVIEGNTVTGTSTAQNVYLTSGTKITIDNLTEGANIGVTTETKPTAGNPVEFTTNGAKSDEAYFFSDSLDYADKYYNEGTCLDLILGYRVTAKTADGGTVSVGNQKSAYDGETINVTVTPDEGYELDTLVLSGEGIIATNITAKKSFTMPAKEVVITGTFNEADYALTGSATITDGAVTFKKGDTAVTTAKFGEEITVTAKEVTGYTVALTSDDVTITDGKFTMPGKAVTITATYTAVAYDLTSASSLSGQGGVTFKKGDATVTTANIGDEITVAATDVDGYTVTLSSDDVTITDGKFTMPAKAVTITATYTASNYSYLDLDETSENKDLYPASKDLTQKYDVSVSTSKTDVTKVQVSWTLTGISASITRNKIWDPDKLEWVDTETNASSATADNVTATFEFKNLSSVKIDASVAFTAESGITSEATYVDNGATGDGKITLDSKALNADATLTGSVVVNVPADTDYFAKLTENKTDAKYGTYTVTISATPTKQD